MNKSLSCRSDSFHSTPVPSPPPLPPVAPPLLLFPPPPPSAFPLPPADRDGGVEEAACRRTFKRSEGNERLSMASHGFRVSQAALCMVSLSIPSYVTGNTGTFCLSVNVIGFLYSGFQLCDLAYHVIAHKHVIAQGLRRQFEFFMDQILAYLLLSAATAVATRIFDGELNWGKDKLTKMASASVGTVFVALISFALSSLLSSYNSAPEIMHDRSQHSKSRRGSSGIRCPTTHI